MHTLLRKHTSTHAVEGYTGIHLKDDCIIIDWHMYFYHFFKRIFTFLQIFAQIFLHGCNKDSNKWAKYLVDQEQPWHLCCVEMAYAHLWSLQSRHRVWAHHQCKENLGEVVAWSPNAWWGRRWGWEQGVHLERWGKGPNHLTEAQENCLKGVAEP